MYTEKRETVIKAFVIMNCMYIPIELKLYVFIVNKEMTMRFKL